MTVGAAVNMCPGVCISDVINKTGMPGKSVKYVTSRPFPPLLVKNEPKQHEELRFEVKEKLLVLCDCRQNKQKGRADRNVCIFCTFSGQLCFRFGSRYHPKGGRECLMPPPPPPPPPTSPFLSGIPGLTFDSPYVPLCICMIFLRSLIASVHFFILFFKTFFETLIWYCS